ncbi:GH92 family glycosyl hydrolase [Rheinheimera texasensis]|uniref:GH92 family glycosyl hydrolase n=1 Tax=Rheinheimera texasensis TaxID=306205 RepID=UPI000560AF22|nr:GH92 family glycosyl hydrolase [Rheinheimera texasensis]
MLKLSSTALGFAAALTLGACSSPAETPAQTAVAASADVLQYVDPFIATGGHGHAFPGAVVPFGMVQLSPDNKSKGWDWTSGYHYSDNELLGFSHTHLSGTGVGDLLDILVLPFHGDYAASLKSPAGRPVATYSHADEQARPGYYAVQLKDQGISAELTATERVGVHRYQFSQAKDAQLLLDLGYAQNYDKAVVGFIRQLDAQTLVGYRVSTGWAKLQPLYFVARFNQPFQAQLYQDGAAVKGTLLQTEKAAAVLNFGDLRQKPLEVAVALSYVSIAGAQKNLAAELPVLDFATVKLQAAAKWQAQLGRFQVDAGTDAQGATNKTKFYTALYHSYLAPQLFSDVDGRYFGADGAVHAGQHQSPRYTLFSLWDTFRGLHPLLTLTDPGRVDGMMHSLYGFYQEQGLLPTWDLMSNETDVMIGHHAVPVLADAYFKGLTTLSAQQLLDASLASARQSRFGIDLFGKYGYVPSDLDVEAVSKTLEYAFDDHAIARLASAAGDTTTAAEFSQRAAAWQQLFDKSTGFMRGKTAKGAWVSPFNPIYVAHRTTDYTEANAWQYSFFVPHQVDAMIKSYGGAEAFVARLDQMFEMSSHMDGDVSPDITGLIGQYAHGNEPVHHVPYLYALAGAPAKGEARIRHIRDTMYHAKPDGLAGNDDLGQMSAWYVLSSLGFYPVNPVDAGYVRGTPQFQTVTLQLDNGKQLRILAKGDRQKPVKHWTLNGVELPISVDYRQLMQGGELVFEF